MYKNIDIERVENIGVIKLARPEKMNALKIWEAPYEIKDAILKLQQEARVIIIQGVGDHFCAGADIKEFKEMIEKPSSIPEMKRMIKSFNDLTLSMRSAEVPIIAACSGYCLGGGAQIASAADIRVASFDAKFGWVFLNIGISSADMGSSWLLPRIVGFGKALELLLTGKIIDADEALKIGFVNKVVKKEKLFDEALVFAKDIAKNHQLVLL